MRSLDNRIRGYCRFTFFSVVLACLAPAPTLAQTRIEIHGADAIGAELMPALIEGYAAGQGLTVRRDSKNNAARQSFQLLSGGDLVVTLGLEQRNATAAFQALVESFAEIAMSTRRIRREEAEAVSATQRVDPRRADSEQVIALDGVAVIVAKSNSLEFIKLSDLAAIFAGDITNWSQLGLPAAPITLHAPAQDASLMTFFDAKVVAPRGLELSTAIQRHSRDTAVASAVSEQSTAIGLVPAAAAVTSAAKITPVALDCGIIVGADAFAMKSEEYPLTRRLYLYGKGERATRGAAALMAFARSDAAQNLVKSLGFVDQGLELQQPEAYGLRLINAISAPSASTAKDEVRRFAGLTRGAVRLSTSFRFALNASILDSKALADAGRVARWLERPENSNAKVTLIGFANAAEADATLSEARAEAARRALLIQVSTGFSPDRVITDGFGAAAPIACEDDPAGRAANRRVEVWVSQ